MISGSSAVYPNLNGINRRSRQGMINVIFGGTLPTETLTDNGDNTHTLNLPDYWMNKIRITTTNKLSYTLVMSPATGTPLNRLIIYCHGHESQGVGTRDSNIALIKAEFGGEYDILEAFLVGYGDDTTQFNTPISFGGVTTGHVKLGFMFQNDFMRVHQWHLIAAVNTFKSSYNKVFTMGFSGGGQQTLLASAMDTRIDGAFPMAWGQPDWLVEADPALYNTVSDPSGDPEQRNGSVLAEASRVGQLALAGENWCHSFHNINENVLPLSAADAATLNTQVQAVSTNFTETTVSGGATHNIEAAWLTAISADLAIL